MEKNKIGNKKKALLLVYICIAWFLPYVYSFIQSYQTDKWIQAIVIILSFVVTTVLYYIFKNRILKLLVMLSAIVCVTVILGYRYTLSACTAFVVIYVYESLNAEDLKTVKINEALLIVSVFVAIAGFIFNFSTIMSIEAHAIVIIVVFAIIFLILAKSAQWEKANKKAKQSNKKAKKANKKAKKTNNAAVKSNKAKEHENDIDTLYKMVFSISIIGVLSSAASSAATNALTFFPWFFFIALLIYKEDESLYSAGEMIVNKIKTFVE